MAERGARVLLVERETNFKDRGRGEALAPWGVENVRRLRLFDRLAEHGNMLQYWRMFLGGSRLPHVTSSRPRRSKPVIAADPTRVADCPISGPEAPHDDAVRARFFREA
jgi:2-polyprenyl-6-methoxyphenol hydroxylase-like FAD-dependent oxidoreductase